MKDREEFTKFDTVVGKIISISREELRRREIEWKKRHKRKKRIKASSASRAARA